MSGQSIIKLSQNSDINSESHYENKALGLSVGVSSSTDEIGSAEPYRCDEFMFIIEGRVNLRNKNTGQSDTFMAGESIVIPRGYNCQWRQQGFLRKFYVIYNPPERLENHVTERVVSIDENSDTLWKTTSDGHRKKILYQNQNQLFTSGVWQSKAFITGLIDFPYNEFILIDKGNLICTDEKGEAHYFSRGDALFIPQGTSCSWEVKTKVSIHYVQIK
jgi:uncharacterized cupin superfamily protein